MPQDKIKLSQKEFDENYEVEKDDVLETNTAVKEDKDEIEIRIVQLDKELEEEMEW